ncbi:MAG: hypothetical protein Q9222_004126, partial [Ikaeria aurantiellina]
FGRFSPRLIVLVRADSGELVDATLSPNTKATLQKLVDRNSVSDRTQTSAPTLNDGPGIRTRPRQISGTVNEGPLPIQSHLSPNDVDLLRIEVPLRNNEEFFHILRHEISHLSTLRDREKATLGQEIHDVGQLVSQVARPSRNAHGTDLSAWKAVFGLYLDCNIFFSTSESNNFNRTPKEAERQLQVFSSRLDELRRTTRFRRKESNVALQRFMLINANLLRSLKFQHLNLRAAGKILKSK